MPTPKEEVYDKKIFPLMKKIIEICKKHKIPFIFDTALGFEDEDDDNQLKCTSCLLEDDCEPSPEMLQAIDLLRPRKPVFAAFTIIKN